MSIEHDDQKEFDGIRQSGNDLPAWYKHIFVYAIFFGIGYTIYFTWFSQWGQYDEYKNQVAEHEERFPKAKVIVSEDGSNPLRGDEVAIAEGQKTYAAVCSACHGAQAQGVVGPNLVDNEWIHGNTDAEVYEVIYNGVGVENAKLNRGPMPAHPALGSEKIYQVMAWLSSNNPSMLPKK